MFISTNRRAYQSNGMELTTPRRCASSDSDPSARSRYWAALTRATLGGTRANIAVL